MSYEMVKQCMDRLLMNNNNLTLRKYPAFPYGQQLIDDEGDYIVFFYHIDRDKVMYFFKGAKDYWFHIEN
ncbi:hypothetical protein WMZ97_10635 [Lentibacillus sp. N15]|uniref:hypothetical protein n=1 Tax=Lentibacillus songyuanensis TaxID=3136161 RepID=UPI0031BB493D